MKKGFFDDPATIIGVIVCGVFALALFVIFAAFVVLPILILTVAGVLLYRWYILEKIKAHDNIPDTIKERPDYLEPSKLLRGLQNERWLLNDAEEETGKYSCQPLADAFHYLVAQLYAQESFHEPPSKPDTTDRITLHRYYDTLQAWQRKVSDENNFELFMHLLTAAYMAMREHFPAFALQPSPEPRNSRLTTPLQIHDEPECVSQLIGAFFDTDYKRRGLFRDIRAQIEQNAEEDPEPTLANYFAHTPFRAFSKVRIPLTLFDETRFAGMWVIAPQGRGKTTLLHTLVAEDIQRDASIILMDSKGDLIEPFLRLASIRDRLVVIGPDNPVGLNPLDIPHTDINKAVDNLEYIFSSLLEFKLTATQSMLLKAVLRALITVFPNPTLETFRDILANGAKKYPTEISQLEPDLQDFFYKEFETDNIRHRRQEVGQRLRLLLDHDIMRKMLLAPLTTFHIGKAMDEGKFIIIDNSKGKLGEQAAEFLGRFFVAQVLAAAQQRSFRPHNTKKPVYFYIDEAHTVIARDEKITTVLHECRSQKIALILAHQETVQLSDHVLSAVQNCAIRFGNPDDEAPKLARSLRTDVETLRKLKRGQFAAFVRELSNDGLVVNVQQTDFSQLPQLPPPRPVLEIQAVQRQAQLPETHKPPETDGLRSITPAEADSPPRPHPRTDVLSIDNTGTPTAPAAQHQTIKAGVSSQPNAPDGEKAGAADPGEPADNW